MINETENKTSLNKMSDLEYVKNDTEMMRYRANGLSYKLGLLAMCFSLTAALLCLNSFNPKSIQVLFIIMMNIVLLLGGFLAAEKVKNYSKGGAIAQGVFGVVCFANIFYIPLLLIIKYSDYMAAKTLKLEDFENSTLFNEAVAEKMGNAESILSASITAKLDGQQAVAYLPSSGYFRGTVAIICLAIAAACFITAGIIGYLRSQKLTNYLDSLKESK